MVSSMLRSKSTPGLLVLLSCWTLALTACTGWFFSPTPRPDRSRPVVMIETREGVEFGAATSVGVLFLGRTAKEGPCRVHHFLGEQLVVDDGRIDAFGGVYQRATIDRKHQGAPLWTKPLEPGEFLVAQRIVGMTAEQVEVRVANDPAVEGDALVAPGIPLPLGSPLFKEADGRLHFVGLISAVAELEEQDAGRRAFLLFAGIDRLAEALAVPERISDPQRVRMLEDNRWVVEPPPREVGRR